MRTPVSHRRGTRSTLISRRSDRRAPVEELIDAATDDHRCLEVSAAATLVIATQLGPKELTLDQASELVADDLMETRRPPSHSGMRNFIGLFPVESRNGARLIWFESLNELHHMRDLWLEGRVASMASQPLLIVWHLPGGVRYHTPDILLRRKSGPALLCDVTRSSQLANAKTKAQLALTATTARLMGWDYEVRTELPAQRVANQSYLYACRQAPARLEAEWRRLLTDIVWPLQLRQVAECLGDGAEGRAAALHLLATAALYADLDRPLRDDTLITAHRPAEGRPAWLAPF